MKLKDRVAIVTGAGRGIGKAIAIRLAKDGAKIVIADIRSEAGYETAEIIKQNGGKAIFQQTDITDEQSIEQCMKTAVETFGTVHILVNNAALDIYGHLKGVGNGSGTVHDRVVTTELWNRTLKTNLVGAADCIKHAATIMKNNELCQLSYNIDDDKTAPEINAGYRGSIINISSIQALITLPEYVPYAAAKAGLLQLTKSCARDFADMKIRVNSVCPGSVETKMAYEHMEDLGLTRDEGRKAFAANVPLKRQGAPQEIAGVVAFLASDDASFMTGANVVVDGGHVL